MASEETPLIAGRIHGIRVWAIESRAGSASLHGRHRPGAGPPAGEADGRASAATETPGGARHRRPPGARPRTGGCGLYAVHPHAATDRARLSRAARWAELGRGRRDRRGVGPGRGARGRASGPSTPGRPRSPSPALAAGQRHSARPLARVASPLPRRAGRRSDDPRRPRPLLPRAWLGAVERRWSARCLPKRRQPCRRRRPPRRRARRPRCSSGSGTSCSTALLVVVGIVWYGGLALVAVLIAIEVINGDFFSSGEPFSERRLRVMGGSGAGPARRRTALRGHRAQHEREPRRTGGLCTR